MLRKIETQKELAVIALILLLTLIPRLVVIGQLPPDLVIAPKSLEYINYARALVNGETWEGMPGGYTHLLYPGILALTYTVFGESVTMARLLNVFISLLLAVAVYLLGKQLFNKQTGALAAILTAGHSLTLYWSVYPLTEQIFLFTMVLAALFYVKGPSGKNLMLSGFFAGLSYLAMPNGLLIFILILIALLAGLKDRKLEKKKIGLYIIAFVMASIPASMFWLQKGTLFPEAFDSVSIMWNRMQEQGVFGLMSKYLNDTVTITVWSFTHSRVKSSALTFMLSIAGVILLRTKRLKVIQILFLGQLLLTPLYPAVSMEPRTAYMGLVPCIGLYAAGMLSMLWNIKYSKKLGRIACVTLLILMALLIFHYRILNDVQETQKYWEYRELALWVKDNTQSTDKIMLCGNSYRPGFYISQYAERMYADCPPGDASAILSNATSNNAKYILLEEVRITYTTDPETKAGLRQIYENNISEESSIEAQLELAYKNTPKDRNIRTEEILESLIELDYTETIRLMWLDLSSHKHTLIRVYKLGQL